MNILWRIAICVVAWWAASGSVSAATIVQTGGFGTQATVSFTFDDVSKELIQIDVANTSTRPVVCQILNPVDQSVLISRSFAAGSMLSFAFVSRPAYTTVTVTRADGKIITNMVTPPRRCFW